MRSATRTLRLNGTAVGLTALLGLSVILTGCSDEDPGGDALRDQYVEDGGYSEAEADCFVDVLNENDMVAAVAEKLNGTSGEENQLTSDEAAAVAEALATCADQSEGNEPDDSSTVTEPAVSEPETSDPETSDPAGTAPNPQPPVAPPASVSPASQP
jgi:hypothetical protein